MDNRALSFPVFVALAAVGWADGSLHPSESAAILRIAEENGLDSEQLVALTSVISGPVSVELINFSAFTEAESAFLYAAAAWLTRLDGLITETEVEALAGLGNALQLSAQQRIQIDGISRDIADLPAGERPERYELGKLRQLLAERWSNSKS